MARSNKRAAPQTATISQSRVTDSRPITQQDITGFERQASAIKVMLWAIRTVGSVELALDAFDRAIAAMEPPFDSNDITID